MVKFDRMMKLPLRMQERNDPDDMETFGSIDLVDRDEMFISLICAENEEHRDQQNILDTRKDAVFILNAVNSFDEMIKLINNYKSLLTETKANSKDLRAINKLMKSFKTIDYENGIPYSWDDDIK